MHGIENVKNLVKTQMVGSKSILTPTYKWNKTTIRSQDLCVLTDWFKRNFIYWLMHNLILSYCMLY